MRKFVIPAFVVAILTNVGSVGVLIKVTHDRDRDRKCSSARAREDVRGALIAIVDGFPANDQTVRTRQIIEDLPALSC